MPPTALTGLRVLVVEDEAGSRDLFETALRQRGAEVVGADSAETALDAFRSTSFDVVVSDVALPHRDGYWLIAQVRALRPRRVVPAVAVAGKAYEPARALAEGFHEYLTKPVDPDRLCATVARLAALIRPA